MTEKLEFYKCKVCENIVQVIIPGVGTLVCCGEDMELMVPKTIKEEMLSEKHVPVIVKTDDGCSEVRIGSVPHPMEESHYIMFIETISKDGDLVHLQYLHPGQEAKMVLEHKLGKAEALEFCNLHGLWTNKNE